jgi:TonB-linked SusC/RagA family outer membrane protein
MQINCNYLPVSLCRAGKPKHCYWVTTQMVRIMKLIAIFLTVAFLQVRADGFTQSTVTFSGKSVSLEKVITAIKQQTGYTFFYTMDIWKDAKPVTLSVKNATVVQVLNLVMEQQPFSYIIEDKTIIISKKKEQQLSQEQKIAEAPPIDIRGRVVNESGEPVQATVTVKGTGKGTSTNQNGEFQLADVDENAVLVVTGVGIEDRELKVAGQRNLSVVVKIGIKALDEVQMIAYGTTTKRFNTGNVSTVKASEIEKQPVNNPLLAMQGRVPGVVITQNTGIPGGGITVRIQGQNSLSRGTDPLYIIDGTPYSSQMLPNISGTFGILGGNGNNNSTFSPAGGGNPLSFINPQDIESINILKDADATAIYGSRAGNGAIIITTKKGKAGKTKIDVNAQTGWGKISRTLPLLNNQQYLEMRHEAKANDNASVLPTDYDINGTWDTTRYTDWQNTLIGGTARFTDASTSFSGGNNNTNFLISGGFHRETTVFPGDFSDQKGSMHFSINNVSTNQKFHLQLTGTYLVDRNQLQAKDLTSIAITLAPDAPALYNSDGTLNWVPLSNGTSTWYNPLAYLYNRYSIKTNNLISNAFISYEVLRGLEIKGSLGYTNLQSFETQIYPLIAYAPETRVNQTRSSVFGNNSINTWNVEPQITYKHKIARGVIDVLIGSTLLQTRSNMQQILGSNYNNDQSLENISAAAALSSYASAISSTYKYNAIFGRLNYNWQNTYIVNISARRDGSSRFGSENLFHNFMSAGAAWLFSNETFVENNLSFLSFGKLRGSYGTTGNDQIGDYQFLNLYNPVTAGVGAAYQGASGLAPNGLPNPYLEWEETQKLQLGLDIGFAKDRIILNTNFFLNRSSNQLQSYALPATTGNQNIQTNLPAEIQNTGWEFSLNTVNLRVKDFYWSTNVNLTLARNKLISFPNLASSTYVNNYIIGEPVMISKVYPFLGVDPSTGLYLYSDKDGHPTSTPKIFTDQISFVNIMPALYGGFQNTVQFKGVELDILFQFVTQKGPNYITGKSPGRFSSSTNPALVPTGNQPEWVLERWQQPDDNTLIQRFSSAYPSTISTPYSAASSSEFGFSDASYIRLKNVSLSWQFPMRWIQKAGLQNVKIYAHGQNLMTITHYKGLDPENQSTLSLPPLKVFTIGLQVGI